MSAGTLSSPAVDQPVNRETEIKSAIKTMLDARRKWAQSDDQFFPAWLEDAISAALNMVLNGDVPLACINVHAACVRLADAWGLIVTEGEGLDPKTGIPGRQFWVLFDSVETLSKSMEVAKHRHLRPVKELLEEYKNDGGRKWLYIARDYGWLDKTGDELTWKGPFFKNGNVDQYSIEKEAREPGSVVPAGWHPEDENEKNRKNIIADSGSALARIRQHLKSQGKVSDAPEDPATIEELLRQGQFVSVIARVKKVSEEEVRAVADRMKIATLNKEDLYQKAQVEGATDDQIYRESMLGADDTSGGSGELMVDDVPPLSATLPAQASSSPAEQTDSEIQDDDNDGNTETPDELLTKLYQANPDIDTPKAMQALKSAGVTMTGQAVGRKLAAMKAKQPATISASAESSES
jgi:hypothetical protein